MKDTTKLTQGICKGPLSAYGSSDQMSCLGYALRDSERNQRLLTGIVTQYNPALYSCVVRCGNTDYSCVLGSFSCHSEWGYSASVPLTEGDGVLIFVPAERVARGIVVCSIPAQRTGSSGIEEFDNLLWSFPGSVYRNRPSFSVPLQSEYDSSTLIADSGRPIDLLQGEIAIVNQNQCGLVGGMFSAMITGGRGTYVRCFALDNRISEVCESYRRLTSSGTVDQTHAGRFIVDESTSGIYQDECAADRYRTIYVGGFFGGLSSRYWMRPEESDESPAGGVARLTVDPSGQSRISASGMLVIERSGRIPVPKRVVRPWQSGAQGAYNKISKQEPFKHDQEHPYYRQLELSDRQAYDLKLSADRMTSGNEGLPHFEMPEESGMKPLSDSYDKGISDSSTVSLEKYDRRRAGIYIGEDGSVVIRDAWGSEIVMSGGNVQISCAGSTEILPGRTALTVAGDDIVNKAMNSVDIVASNHDVRICGERNVQIAGGSKTGSSAGGVLIESRSRTPSPWKVSGTSVGEGVSSSGVVIKSPDSGILVDAEYVQTRGRKRVGIVTGEEEISGSVGISTGTFSASSESAIVQSRKSGLVVSEDSVVVAGNKSAVVASGSSTVLVQGTKIPVMIWVDSGIDVTGTLLDALKNMSDVLMDEEKAASPYPWSYVKEMYFSFRTSDQCGTGTGWEIGSLQTHFTMYEPYWAQSHSVLDTLESVKPETYSEPVAPDEKDDEEPDRGVAWPGSDAMSDGVYVSLPGVPAGLTEKGFNNRSGVPDRTEVNVSSLYSGYKVPKN